MAPAKLAVLVLGSLGVLGAWAANASAQECSDTSPCPKGFKCEVTAVSGCATPAVAPQRPCPDAGTCSPNNPVPPPVPECKMEEYRSCVPGPCMADGDCATGMVCYTQSVGGVCSTQPAAPCPPGGACGAPVPSQPVCTPATVERQCVPRYLLPCEQASDCGPGFTCEPHQECGCSAGAGSVPMPGIPAPMRDAGQDADEPQAAPVPTPASDAGTPDEAPSRPGLIPPSCTCTPTAQNYCKQAEIECTSDGQCPSMWTCKTVAVSGGTAPACRPLPGADGGVSCPAADPVAPVEIKRCVPPYDGVNVAVTPRGESAPTVPVGAPGAAPAPSTNNPGPTPTSGSLPPSAQNPGDENANASPPPPVHAKACSVTHAGGRTHGGLWLSILSLAAAWFATRRRR